MTQAPPLPEAHWKMGSGLCETKATKPTQESNAGHGGGVPSGENKQADKAPALKGEEVIGPGPQEATADEPHAPT
jgi:hypothetical protein